jgi:hypothetical protein
VVFKDGLDALVALFEPAPGLSQNGHSQSRGGLEASGRSTYVLERKADRRALFGVPRVFDCEPDEGRRRQKPQDPPRDVVDDARRLKLLAAKVVGPERRHDERRQAEEEREAEDLGREGPEKVDAVLLECRPGNGDDAVLVGDEAEPDGREGAGGQRKDRTVNSKGERALTARARRTCRSPGPARPDAGRGETFRGRPHPRRAGRPAPRHRRRRLSSPSPG